MPTADAIQERKAHNIPAAYQLIYHNSNLRTPDSNQQRLRILIWLDRINFNIAQLDQLEQLRQEVLKKEEQLALMEKEQRRTVIQDQTPIYNQLWDLMRTGANLDSEQTQPLLDELNQLRTKQEQENLLDARLETIKSILDLEADFLRNLSPEQEATIVDAIYFLRYILDPIANPKDFSLLVGTTYEPGQYAILLKGTSSLASRNGNIGGLWSDEPELTGRILHEARREVILYLALLDPNLEEAIRAAKERKSVEIQSNTPSDQPK